MMASGFLCLVTTQVFGRRKTPGPEDELRIMVVCRPVAAPPKSLRVLTQNNGGGKIKHARKEDEGRK